MAEEWRVNYEQLQNFIAKNPSIKITPSVIFIGSDKRAEFYQLFNMVRTEFVKEYLPVELEQSCELSRNWKIVSKSLIDNMHLKAINIETGVKWFLADPADGLIRGLDNLLFDLLKNRIEIDGFKDKAMQIISSEYQRYFCEGYKVWAILSLIKLLDGDKVYTVMASDERIDSTMLEADPGAGICEEDVPEARETNEILFENVDICSFLTPRIIIHSNLLKCFVALRPHLYKAHWKARFLNENQEWLSIKAINKTFGESRIWPDLALYISNNLSDLKLVADYRNIARPDIIIDFNDGNNWPEQNVLAATEQHYNVLKPKLGAFVVSRTNVPDSIAVSIKTNTLSKGAKTAEPAIVPDQIKLESNLFENESTAGNNDSVAHKMNGVEDDSNELFNINIITTGFNVYTLKPVVNMLLEAIHLSKMNDN